MTISNLEDTIFHCILQTFELKFFFRIKSCPLKVIHYTLHLQSSLYGIFETFASLLVYGLILTRGILIK
jgi:hypothetical protein